MEQSTYSVTDMLREEFENSTIYNAETMTWETLTAEEQLEWAVHVGKKIGYGMAAREAEALPPEAPAPASVILSVADVARLEQGFVAKVAG